MGDLLTATRDLMAVPSVSRNEAALADQVEAALRVCPWLEVTRIGNNVVARTDQGLNQRLVMAGHLDTVPPGTNASPGSRVTPCGVSARRT